MIDQEWFTAAELAELVERLEVLALPTTKRGVALHIDEQGWDQTLYARQRSGRGGGMEYHISLLPERLFVAISADRARQAHLAALAERKAREAETRAVEERLQPGAKLRARQSTIRDARAAVVQEVLALQARHGLTRAQAVQRFLDLLKTGDVNADLVTAANARASRNRSLSRATLYLWIKAYEAGEGVSALAPKLARESMSFPDWFPKFMAFYARPQKPTIAAALDDLRYKAELDDVPSYDQVRRCLKRLDKSHGTQARYRGREGALALKARHAYVSRDTSDLLPTSVYTADGKTFDAEIQHPSHGRAFRPEITFVLDVATRTCVGWSVALAENTHGVLDALRSSCQNCGIPAIFYVDRGPGFKNATVQAFCARIGITISHSIPYNSQARGIIERFNRTVPTPLAKTFQTYIGEDMDRQARQASYKATRRDVAEFGTSSLLPTWNEFTTAIGEAVDRYNDSVHSALEQKDKKSGRKIRLTPNQAWARHVADGFEAVHIDAHEVDDLFRPYERRKTRRACVELWKSTYFHLDLEPYDGSHVFVGYDIHDGSRVWVREIEIIDGSEQPGALIAVAAFDGNRERYFPISAEQVALERRATARLRRIEEKAIEARAEINPNRFLNQSAEPGISIGMGIQGRAAGLTSSSQPMTIAAVASEVPAPPPQTQAATATSSNGDRPKFDDDESFAAWCCENPEKLSEKDLTLLRSLLRDKSARECLRIHGVDLRAVENLIRSVA